MIEPVPAVEATRATPTLDELTLADEPARWQALGFNVSGDRCRLAGVSVRLAGADAGRGIVGWSIRGLSSTELDGLPTSRSEGGGRAVEPAPEHPNGVLAIDHIVAVSPSLDRTVDALQAAGLDLRRVREEPTPAGAPRQAFFRLGEEILEVIQEPAEVLERTGDTDRPAFFWGLALRVRDIEATVEQLGADAGSIRAAVQPGRRIATLRRSAGLAVPVALIS
jgi:hypothetical protein